MPNAHTFKLSKHSGRSVAVACISTGQRLKNHIYGRGQGREHTTQDSRDAQTRPLAQALLLQRNPEIKRFKHGRIFIAIILLPHASEIDLSNRSK
jgi:hypothetical protein